MYIRDSCQSILAREMLHALQTDLPVEQQLEPGWFISAQVTACCIESYNVLQSVAQPGTQPSQSTLYSNGLCQTSTSSPADTYTGGQIIRVSPNTILAKCRASVLSLCLQDALRSHWHETAMKLTKDSSSTTQTPNAVVKWVPRALLPTSTSNPASTGTPPNDHLTELWDELRTSSMHSRPTPRQPAWVSQWQCHSSPWQPLGGSMLKLNALPKMGP